jgi:hypothetical protein
VNPELPDVCRDPRGWTTCVIPPRRRSIELHRRIARGFRNHDNYRLRMLHIGGGLRP